MKLTLRGLGPVARGAPVGKDDDLVDVKHHGGPRDLAGQIRLELGRLRVRDDGSATLTVQSRPADAVLRRLLLLIALVIELPTI